MLCDSFAEVAPEDLETRHRAVDAAIMAAVITFTVYSSRIIEYVQRFGRFQGFSPRAVAELTHAAGGEERMKALPEAARS